MNTIYLFNEDLGRFVRVAVEIIEYSSDIQKERNKLKSQLSKIVEKSNIQIEKPEFDNDAFRMKLLSKYDNFVDKMTFIYVASKFEAFLNDVYLHLIEIFPNSLKSNKTITHERLLNFNSLEEFKSDLKQNMVEEYSFASFSDKMKILNEKFKIDHTTSKYNEIIIEFLTTRNILLHNDGKVNETFIKFNPHLELKFGDEVEIENSKTLKYSMQLIEFSAILIDLIEKKLNK